MSYIAPPVPKLRKKAHLFNSLKNQQALLRWALEYVQIVTDDLYKSSVMPNGKIQGRDTQVEIPVFGTGCQPTQRHPPQIVAEGIGIEPMRRLPAASG